IHQITKYNARPPLTRRSNALTATAIAAAETNATTARVDQSVPAKTFTKLINSLSSGLLKFDEGAVEILRMQEKHRLPMRSDLRLPPPQPPCTPQPTTLPLR